MAADMKTRYYVGAAAAGLIVVFLLMNYDSVAQVQSSSSPECVCPDVPDSPKAADATAEAAAVVIRKHSGGERKTGAMCDKQLKFLSHFEEDEIKARKVRQGMLVKLIEILDTVAPPPGLTGLRYIDSDNPKQPIGNLRLSPFFDVTHRCSKLERHGGDDDGGKWLCGVKELSQDPSCVIFSLGSNGNWKFEKSMFANTQCVIHTFDCTGDYPAPPTLTSRVTSHKVCAGSGQERNGLKYLTFEGLCKEAGVDCTKVILLKMDIEAWEWDVFPYLINGNHKPLQISAEVHLLEPQKLRGRSAGEVMMLNADMYDNNYRIISTESNPPNREKLECQEGNLSCLFKNVEVSWILVDCQIE